LTLHSLTHCSVVTYFANCFVFDHNLFYALHSHPGCHCQEGYLGPHCELRESSEVADIRNNDPYANQLPQSSSSDGPNGFTIFVLVLSVTAVFIVVLFSIRRYLRRRRQRNTAISTNLNWSAANFRDGDGTSEINLAPKRESVQYSDDDDDNDIIIPYEDAMITFSGTNVYPLGSTRDLMMETSPRQQSFSKDIEYYNDDDDYAASSDTHYPDDLSQLPQIDIGPPIDEDGHILHNVDIV
jgi:hypothetical protein